MINIFPFLSFISSNVAERLDYYAILLMFMIFFLVTIVMLKLESADPLVEAGNL